MRSAADVYRLLARFGIEYRANGRELWAPCPAHEERTAGGSWSINVQTGIHHCFSCGWGGNAAELVIQALGTRDLAWEQRDAWEWIREQGLLVGDSDSALDVELYLVRDPRRTFTMPAGVVFAPLVEWPTPAKRYMTKRGIQDWQIQRWCIGYATGGRLAGRIVFPVFNGAGKLVSYTARSFVGDEPRYLTPRENEGAEEAALFGERYWPGPGSRRRVVLVEGGIKALAVERAVGGAVAGVLGATQAQNPRVHSKLSTFEEVVVLTDNDVAGDVAADVLIGALSRHTAVKRAKLDGPAVDDAALESVAEAVNS